MSFFLSSSLKVESRKILISLSLLLYVFSVKNMELLNQKNVNLGFSIVPVRRVAIIFFQFGVGNFMQKK